MISEDSSQAHGTSMKDGLVAEAAKTRMAVDNLDLLSDDDVPKNREEGEYGWHRGLAIDDQEWHMIDFEAIGQVVNSCAALIGVSDDYDFVSSIDQLG